MVLQRRPHLTPGWLVELQSAKARFEKQGIKVAAISYDSEEILKYFAERRKIDFPLIADLDSQTIRAYQVLNTEAVGQFKEWRALDFSSSIPRASSGKSSSKRSIGIDPPEMP